VLLRFIGHDVCRNEGMCDLIIRQARRAGRQTSAQPGRAGASMDNDSDPDFLYVAPSKTACAAFSKESRMKFASATKVHRKSGEAP